MIAPSSMITTDPLLGGYSMGSGLLAQQQASISQQSSLSDNSIPQGSGGGGAGVDGDGMDRGDQGDQTWCAIESNAIYDEEERYFLLANSTVIAVD